jgi:hypothetical protein
MPSCSANRPGPGLLPSVVQLNKSLARHSVGDAVLKHWMMASGSLAPQASAYGGLGAPSVHVATATLRSPHSPRLFALPFLLVDRIEASMCRESVWKLRGGQVRPQQSGREIIPSRVESPRPRAKGSHSPVRCCPSCGSSPLNMGRSRQGGERGRGEGEEHGGLLCSVIWSHLPSATDDACAVVAFCTCNAHT